MTEHNWKPGDVALVRATYGPSDNAPAEYVASRNARSWTLLTDHNEHWHDDYPDIECWPLRPLVVIDPEDEEQVGRLVQLLKPEQPTSESLNDSMTAALREFATPTPPRPDEPQEFAAIAVEADGTVWHRVRDGEADGYPWATKDSKAKWRTLEIVRTLPPPTVE